jgi:hypothetical protein
VAASHARADSRTATTRETARPTAIATAHVNAARHVTFRSPGSVGGSSPPSRAHAKVRTRRVTITESAAAAALMPFHASCFGEAFTDSQRTPRCDRRQLPTAITTSYTENLTVPATTPLNGSRRAGTLTGSMPSAVRIVSQHDEAKRERVSERMDRGNPELVESARGTRGDSR